MKKARESQSPWYAVRGVTLIELLVALVIFGVLGVMGYRAVSMAVDSRERVVAELQRWRDIAGFFQVLENDLAQYAERPQPGQQTGSPNADTLHLSVASDGTTEFSFLRVDGTGGAVRRRGYRFEPGQIVQLRWPGSDALSLPDRYVVLAKVTSMKCVTVDGNGVKRPQWPLQSAGAAMPVALDIQVELPDAGTIRRLISLR
ncbi:MAG TPA: type II secretion system protein GspJ [Rhodocyclaceae bacterium]|nr:type II secretion system protein GspJ [Rhodocyclaceae bacterium]